ncbi:hypothetical protein, unlikely [Trypanosoma congolense IL3000]|uniref:Uncharacterized protein n=1 Tax=Trypanosoma congolense (strain IL3000) TaxID=1068625 RepID=F9WEW1_TRYCI|nr:hypothetical protein, unlikely [Trypanosoma congolense IL3000]
MTRFLHTNRPLTSLRTNFSSLCMVPSHTTHAIFEAKGNQFQCTFHFLHPLVKGCLISQDVAWQRAHHGNKLLKLFPVTSEIGIFQFTLVILQLRLPLPHKHSLELSILVVVYVSRKCSVQLFCKFMEFIRVGR